MYSCMDGVSMEVTRALSLRGAQLLSNSLCSFAPDEDWLHLPVRAAENKVYVAAANKVGRLVPDGLIAALVGARDSQDAREMMGGGASQIVAPDGTVLARAPVDREAVIWADVDLEAATGKQRPDGTDIFADRRPELYGPIVTEPRAQDVVNGAERLLAGVAHGAMDDALSGAVSAVSGALARGVEFLTLPELAFLPDGQVDDIDAAAEIRRRGIASVAEALSAADVRCPLSGGYVGRPCRRRQGLPPRASYRARGGSSSPGHHTSLRPAYMGHGLFGRCFDHRLSRWPIRPRRRRGTPPFPKSSVYWR